MTHTELLLDQLHDALLCSIDVDYVAAEATFKFDAIVDVDSNSGIPVRRRAWLRVSGLSVLVIDPPGPGARSDARNLRVDCGSGQPNTAPAELPDTGSNAVIWIFVSEWNAFIRVVGREIELQWF